MRRSSQIRYVSLGSGSGLNAVRQPGSLLGRIVALLVGGILFGLAVFLGAIFIAGMVGLILIASIIFMLRIWWLKRKMERDAREYGDLDAEYTVVRESDPHDNRGD